MSVKPCKHDCFYWSKDTHTCDYILIEGHSRGCPAGEKCKHYKASTLKDKKELWAYSTFHKAKVAQVIPKEMSNQVLELYEAGYTDVSIGRLLMVAPRAVSRWRINRGLKSNFDKYLTGELKEIVE